MHSSNELTQALLSLIRVSGVRRSSHQLLIDQTETTPLFIELLRQEKFDLARIEEIAIEPGERVPAFHVDKSVAHFGWVFWEGSFPGECSRSSDLQGGVSLHIAFGQPRLFIAPGPCRCWN